MKQKQAWSDYWKGLEPRPIPVDHEAIKRVAQQIKDMPRYPVPSVELDNALAMPYEYCTPKVKVMLLERYT